MGGEMFKYNWNEEDATHTHAQQTKQEIITKGLALCFGAGPINIGKVTTRYYNQATLTPPKNI